MLALRAPHAFDGESFLEGGATVLVDGSRIAGVEPAAYDVPDGCEVRAYDGTLLPGLIDSHVHLVADSTLGGLERAPTLTDDALDAVVAASLAAQAAAGVTTVQDLGDCRFRTLLHRDRCAPGTPRIVAAGPPLTVPGGHCHFLGGEAAGVDGVRAAVADHVARGVDVVKVMASGGMLTPGTDVFGVQFDEAELRALVDAAHDAGRRVLAHAHSQAGAWHAVRAGADSLEHASCLTEHGPDTPEELLAAIAAAGTTISPTSAFDRSKMLPLDQVPPTLRATMERLGLDPDSILRTQAEQLARVRAHGIRVVSGVDAGVAPPKAHGMVWRAVVGLLDSGYPVAEALATATSVAADALGLAAETGRLATGLAADLLVVDGDLALDPASLARPLAVLVRGEPAVSGPAPAAG